MNKIEDVSQSFQFAERCMFHYLENLALIAALREDLRMADMQSSLKVCTYEEYLPTVGYIDNVPRRILRMDMLKSLIARVERCTNPITRLLNDLDSPHNSQERQDMLGILRVRYIQGNSPERSADYLKMARSTYYERRKRLVAMVISYMGLNGRTDSVQIPDEFRTDSGLI